MRELHPLKAPQAPQGFSLTSLEKLAGILHMGATGVSKQSRPFPTLQGCSERTQSHIRRRPDLQLHRRLPEQTQISAQIRSEADSNVIKSDPVSAWQSGQHNMLHFVLAMMTPESASGLFSEEAVILMKCLEYRDVQC